MVDVAGAFRNFLLKDFSRQTESLASHRKFGFILGRQINGIGRNVRHFQRTTVNGLVEIVRQLLSIENPNAVPSALGSQLKQRACKISSRPDVFNDCHRLDPSIDSRREPTEQGRRRH